MSIVCECGRPIEKRPGPGRWPKRCAECRTAKNYVTAPTSCQGCGETIKQTTRRGNPRRWCSESCRVATGRRNGRYETNTWAPRCSVSFLPCELCGDVFTARTSKARVCKDPSCRRQYHRNRAGKHWHTRRARVLGTQTEPVDKLVVFERDGWACGLCGGPIDPDVQHPDKFSASLDHIVPLSRGGNHTYDNVQAAHLACNSRKSNRTA